MPRVKQQFPCLDFFAGSGLVSFALDGTFNTVWANDISEDKQKVYQANRPAETFKLGPIEDVSGADLPSVMLSWGSFPCQDLSLAGNMVGLSGERSGLFWQWMRVMKEMKRKPPIAVAENVVGLVASENGENYIKVHNALRDAGYTVGAVMLDAVNWVPQSRKRIFVIAVESRFDVSAFVTDGPTWCHFKPICDVAKRVEGWTWWKMPEPISRQLQLESIVDFDAPCNSEESTKYLLSLVPPHKMEAVHRAARRGRKVFPAYRRTRNHRQVLELREDGIAGCLRTPAGGSSRQVLILADGTQIKSRLLTLRETASLMGAPDFILPGSYNDGYMAMGDGVAVPAVEYLSKNLLYPIAKAISNQK